MSSALDMSLDEIIKNNKSNTTKDSKPRFRGRGRGGGGPGPTRRFNNRSANRSNPYTSAPKAPESAWKHDMYSDQVPAAAGAYGGGAGGGAGAIETGTKLYISNLDYGVSNEDIKELFSEVGDLKRFSIHYDRSGRSKGTAEVVFSRRLDAVAAVKRYNNVQLDGKPMKIEIVGTNIATPPAPQPLQVSNGGFGNPSGVPRSFSGRGGFNGLSRGGGPGGRGRAGGRGRGRGRGGGRAEPASVADLDADLEKYHSEAMQTN